MGNRLLNPSQRQEATSVYQTLHEISRWSVYPPVAEIKEHITKRINQANGEIDYIQICCFNTLKNLDVLDRKALVIVNAIWGGNIMQQEEIELILKASNLVKWEHDLLIREEELEKRYSEISGKMYKAALSGIESKITLLKKDRDSYKLALKREQKAHAETRLDHKRSIK